ncbi:MAG: glycosyltransferase, partial [Bacteroidota bacterium]
SDKITGFMKETTIILIPVYNDWISLNKLLTELEELLINRDKTHYQLLIINDGSSEKPDIKSGKLLQVKIIDLTANLGHQKAIAAGMSYIHHSIQCNNILIMDADGEDQPEDAIKLLDSAKSNPGNLIIGIRRKRNDGFSFRVYYLMYKLLFRILTGKRISFGHFMVIPKKIADRLVYQSDIWNNLAATVLKTEITNTKINTNKGFRYNGKSKMNFNSLLLHGLGAIAVFIENIAVRLLTFSLMIIGLSSIIIIIILGIKWFTALAIPGWASVILSTILIVLLQGFLLSLFTIFLFLSSQSYRKFIPARHYTDYIRENNY